MIAVDALLASVPFIAVARTGTVRKAPWLVGLALTVALWGYLLYEGVSYQWHPDGTSATGAALGFGFVLLASTFFITAVCLGVYWLQRRGTR